MHMQFIFDKIKSNFVKIKTKQIHFKICYFLKRQTIGGQSFGHLDKIRKTKTGDIQFHIKNIENL